MSAVDDWGPQPAADDWQPVGTSDATFDDRFAGEQAPPRAFLDRLVAGRSLDERMKRAVANTDALAEGFGSEPLGWSNENVKGLMDMGLLHDPALGAPTPLRLLSDSLVYGVPKVVDATMRSINAGLHFTGSVAGHAVEDITGSETQGGKAKNELINFGNYLITNSMASFGRLHPSGEQVVGTLPKEADFKLAAETGLNEARLRDLWQEKGIHPAEAAHDAQSDAFLKHDLAAPIEYSTRGGVRHGLRSEAMQVYREQVAEREQLAELEGAPHPLGAAVADEPSLPPIVPLSQQPAPPAGRVAAAVQSAADALLDIGKDIQMKVAPMATGTTESMAAAKDFANTMRRNRWEWSRVDDDIAKRFTPEQRKRMWDAADEESVARQLGESTEHQGLVTLTAEERAAVDDLHARAQNAWVRAHDIGLVEGEGLPAYTPRMVLNTANAVAGDGALPLNSIGANLKTSSGNLKQRKHMTAEETEAAAKTKFGAEAEIARDIRTLPLSTAKLEDAIAGRSLINNIRDIGKSTGDEMVAEGAIPAGSEHKWFTLDHPAFRTWRPRFERNADGSLKLEGNSAKVMKDENGHEIFEQVPLYIRDDFEGPLKAVLNNKSGPGYQALMSIKGKTMSLIMNSPLIHNAVEFGRAFPAMPTRIVQAYFQGYRAKNDPAIMREAIDNGLVPIGKRFFNQDVNGIMEAPDLTPGRSTTAKLLAVVPGLFDEAAGVAVKRAIDKAGNFWHNTLLWDRIADLQMGLYVNLRGDIMAKGVDPQTASRVAAHFANRYAGALPKEAMSDGATKIANFLMFSRTFTIGNLGVMKDALTGLPKDVLAQIHRDMGVVDPKAVGYAKDMARRKAMAVIVADIGLLYVVNSIFQNALNVMLMDSTISEEAHGYARRFREVMNQTEVHPLSLLSPMSVAGAVGGFAVAGPGGALLGGAAGTALSTMGRMSATAENEPGKQERLKIGYTKDGTAIYARSPFGKIGEEFVGYLNGPLDMFRRKEGTIARPLQQTLANDKGFGRKVYDPNAETPLEKANVIWSIVKHFGEAQTPEGQIRAFSDFVKGDGDPKVNLLQTFGPIAGVTFSKGAPGGQAVGEMYKAREIHDYQVNLALPDIRKQIQRGDIQGATDRMNELKIPAGLQKFYMRTSMNPATRLSPKALKDFYLYSTPEQRDRMERVR